MTLQTSVVRVKRRLLRTCSLCGESKPDTHDNFVPSSYWKDACRICVRARNKAVYEARAERHRKNPPPRPITKKCALCRKTYSGTEFNRCDKQTDGWDARCRSCKTEQERSRRKNLNKRDPILFCVRRMVQGARCRSKARGIPFNLEVEDVLPFAVEFCPALGTPMEYELIRLSRNSATLDRIKPELGYVVGNVAIISHAANIIKSNATAKEVRLVSEWMQKLEDGEKNGAFD